MKTTLSRRNWFKSSFALGTGLAFTPALIDSLMAAPVSEAERLHNLTSFAPDQLVRLGSNENPYGPSAKAREALKLLSAKVIGTPIILRINLRKQLQKKRA
jgi:histidinol-phosphate aminotransferase